MDPTLALRLLVTPATVLLASLVQRRLGPAAGGSLVGLPLTTGPFLAMIWCRSGPHPVQIAAAGVVAGQLSVVAFCATYAAVARRVRPCGAVAAAVSASLVGGTVGLAAHAVAAPTWLIGAGVLVAIGVSLRALPTAGSVMGSTAPTRPWETPLRMLTSAAVVGTLVESSDALGAGLAGVLATAPVILTIIVPSTHRRAGAPSAVAIARGALASLPASVVAVGLLAETLDRAPAVAAVGLAGLGLVAVELRRALGREAQDRRAVRQGDLHPGDLVHR